ncbi:MAG: murein L,D-transpeptidase family protein [Pseudomonadota bacterium]
MADAPKPVRAGRALHSNSALVLFVGLAVFVTVFHAPLLRFVEGFSMGWERSVRLARWHAGLPQIGAPDTARLAERLAAKDLKLGDAVLFRVFKQESELELWMRSGDRFVRFASYPICRWSGQLGPKFREGDRQSPEGFYTVAARQLNPRSRWHRSFNIGFPNAFDRSHGRTGSFIMVHGGCSSIGCFAVTNDLVDEIWRIIRAAFAGGQQRFQVHSFPFRMTPERTARYANSGYGAARSASQSPVGPYWRDLAQGYRVFEETRAPLAISVCGRRYQIGPGGGPRLATPALSNGCGPQRIQAVPLRRPGAAQRTTQKVAEPANG